MEVVETFVLPAANPMALLPRATAATASSTSAAGGSGGASATSSPAAATAAPLSELQRIEHNWSLRSTLLSLLQFPPSHLHGLVFDAKAVLCSLLVHLHLPFLDLDELPQLTDVKVAAWLTDPDDLKKTELDMGHLMSAHCGPYVARARHTRAQVSDPGEHDVDVFLQDVSDLPILLSSVAHRLEQQSLLRPFVEQELFLLPVIIDMQLRGVQVDLKQLGQAKLALKRHIDQIVRTNTYVCGDALFRARVNAHIAWSALLRPCVAVSIWSLTTSSVIIGNLRVRHK
jgi:hypothetical protein